MSSSGLYQNNIKYQKFEALDKTVSLFYKINDKLIALKENMN